MKFTRVCLKNTCSKDLVREQMLTSFLVGSYLLGAKIEIAKNGFLFNALKSLWKISTLSLVTCVYCVCKCFFVFSGFD